MHAAFGTHYKDILCTGGSISLIPALFFELTGTLALRFGDMVPANSAWFPGAEMINSCQGFLLPMRDTEEPLAQVEVGRRENEQVGKVESLMAACHMLLGFSLRTACVTVVGRKVKFC